MGATIFYALLINLIDLFLRINIKQFCVLSILDFYMNVILFYDL